MKIPTNVPKLRDYGRMVVSGWFIVVMATAASAGIGWVSWLTMTPVYQSSSTVMITSPGAATTIDAFYGQLNSASRALNYQMLARSERVTSETIEQLGLTDSTGGLAGRITVLPVASTMFSPVIAGTDPDETRQTAQGITDNLINVQRQLSAVDGSGVELTQLDPAGTATRVGSMWRTIGQAAALGFAFSTLLTLAFYVYRGRLLTSHQLGRVIREATTEAAPASP